MSRRRVAACLALGLLGLGPALVLGRDADAPPAAAPAVTTTAPTTTTAGSPTTTATTEVPVASRAPTAAPPRCDPVCTAAAASIEEATRRLVVGGEIGFLLVDREGRVRAEWNPDTRFYPASAIKVVHLVHALRSWDGTAGWFDRTIPLHHDTCAGTGAATPRSRGDLLWAMMVDSSNAATNALQDHFGLEALRATMTAAGMTDSDLYHRFGCGGPDNDPANSTTASDLAGLYAAVAEGDLLDGAARERFFGIIRDEGTTAVSTLAGDLVLPLATPPVSHVYLKEGWYGTTLTVGGMAVLEDGDWFAFAAFVDGAQSITPGFDILQVVAALIAVAVG